MIARALSHLRPVPFLGRGRLTPGVESRVLKLLALDPHGFARNIRRPQTARLGSPPSFSDSVSTSPYKHQASHDPRAVAVSQAPLAKDPRSNSTNAGSTSTTAIICRHAGLSNHAAAGSTGCGPTELEVAVQCTLGSKRLGSTCSLLLSVMENRESIKVSLRLWGCRPRSSKREWTAL